MKNNVDYIYEYSDLTPFQTRVQILTGKYKDVILEFGGSWVESSEMGDNFTFNYIIYEKPYDMKLYKDDKEFTNHLSQLLINIIDDRNNDKDERIKLMEAASCHGVLDCKIKINNKFYQNKNKNHIKSQEIKEF
jgi:hypothetical protein